MCLFIIEELITKDSPESGFIKERERRNRRSIKSQRSSRACVCIVCALARLCVLLNVCARVFAFITLTNKHLFY